MDAASVFTWTGVFVIGVQLHPFALDFCYCCMYFLRVFTLKLATECVISSPSVACTVCSAECCGLWFGTGGSQAVKLPRRL